MGLSELVYSIYGRRIQRNLDPQRIPRHVAVMIDGNRRWARQRGFDSVSVGHRYGAEHVETVLSWCSAVGIRHVTVFVVSADNIRKRSAAEVEFLMDLAEHVVVDRLARPSSRWELSLTGQLDLLPDSTAHALKRARDATLEHQTDSHLTLAIGYSGRAELVDALRALLESEARSGTTARDLAERLTVADIAAHLTTSGQPDPDLVIRTSGEQRLSDFLLWQTTGSELYFCDVFWPGFRQVDFLRALRSYAARTRRSA
jgi:short-chain Z-isoprenyl diphosphate synthase